MVDSESAINELDAVVGGARLVHNTENVGAIASCTDDKIAFLWAIRQQHACRAFQKGGGVSKEEGGGACVCVCVCVSVWIKRLVIGKTRGNDATNVLSRPLRGGAAWGCLRSAVVARSTSVARVAEYRVAVAESQVAVAESQVPIVAARRRWLGGGGEIRIKG